MSTKNIIIGIVVLALILLGIWFFMSQGDNDGLLSGNDNSSATTTGSGGTGGTGSGSGSGSGSGTPATGSGSLKSAFAQGGNYTCNITTVSGGQGQQTSGTVYASGNKTRVDFRVKASNGTVTDLYVIRDGSFSYTWVGGQTTGTKTQITASSPVVPRQPSGAGVTADITDDSPVSWECRPWLPDTTKFVPPTSITFTAS